MWPLADSEGVWRCGCRVFWAFRHRLGSRGCAVRSFGFWVSLRKGLSNKWADRCQVVGENLVIPRVFQKQRPIQLAEFKIGSVLNWENPGYGNIAWSPMDSADFLTHT